MQIQNGLRANQERDLKHKNAKHSLVTLEISIRAADSFISPSSLCVATETRKVKREARKKKKHNLAKALPPINNAQYQYVMMEAYNVRGCLEIYCVYIEESLSFCFNFSDCDSGI